MSALRKIDDFLYECHQTKKMLTEDEFLDEYDDYRLSPYAMADFGCLNLLNKLEPRDPDHIRALANFNQWANSDLCLEWFKSRHTLWVRDNGQLRKPKG
jgi:hypothetical protein